MRVNSMGHGRALQVDSGRRGLCVVQDTTGITAERDGYFPTVATQELAQTGG